MTVIEALSIICCWAVPGLTRVVAIISWLLLLPIVTWDNSKNVLTITKTHFLFKKTRKSVRKLSGSLPLELPHGVCPHACATSDC